MNGAPRSAAGRRAERRWIRAAVVAAGALAMLVPAHRAEAAAHTIDAIVVVPVIAVSTSAPAGSLAINCSGGRFGTFTYSDGNGSTLSGLVLSCGTSSGAAEPLTIKQSLSLHIMGGTGLYAGAGGLGNFSGLVVYGGLLGPGVAVGSVHFDVTTP